MPTCLYISKYSYGTRLGCWIWFIPKKKCTCKIEYGQNKEQAHNHEHTNSTWGGRFSSPSAGSREGTLHTSCPIFECTIASGFRGCGWPWGSTVVSPTLNTSRKEQEMWIQSVKNLGAMKWWKASSQYRGRYRASITTPNICDGLRAGWYCCLRVG